MKIVLRLLTPVVGLVAAPWMLIATSSAKNALIDHPWFAALVAVTTLLSAALIFYIAHQQALAIANALSDSIARGAVNNFASPLGTGAPKEPQYPALAAAEEMRHVLHSREQSLQRDIDAERAHLAKKKAECDADSQRYVDAHNFFLKTFNAALNGLAEGDLSVRLKQPYSSDYESLRHCYNRSIAELNSVFSSAISGIHNLQDSTADISTQADQLSTRTCQQAASLEETSAALKQITSTVGRTADGAQRAKDVVSEARGDAEDSTGVVHQAIGAMSRIEKSSQEIEQIIGVIDEIAFQTNLLALNAGVEAARAGEAGRGFAVVASEVRALAQRSAEAAKEIKGLIAASTFQVHEGVQLVGKTGESLNRIVSKVADASNVVAEIADNAKEQSIALREVNSALTQMDQFTQQNAAMVERTNDSSRQLRQDIEEIVAALAAFSLSEARQQDAVKPRAALPSRQPSQRLSVSRGGAAAALREPEAQSWEEF
jgi:methyl-accepting chemotaxis protein